MNNYEKQANDFLKKYNCTMTVEFLKYDFHFDGDKDKRDIYKIALKRGSREMVLKFGQSINCSMQYIPKSIYAKNLWNKENCPRIMGKNKIEALKKAGIYYYSLNESDFVKNENFKEPTAYSVLVCLQKYDVGTFEDFCSEFGYDEDSKKAEKTYNAVLSEYKDVCSLFNDEELAELQEIQ